MICEYGRLRCDIDAEYIRANVHLYTQKCEAQTPRSQILDSAQRPRVPLLEPALDAFKECSVGAEVRAFADAFWRGEPVQATADVTALDAFGAGLDIGVTLSEADQSRWIGIRAFDHIIQTAGLPLDMP